MSLRDDALNAADVPEELVTVPEWGGSVFLVRGLTAGEQADFYDKVSVVKNGEVTINKKLWSVELVIACAFDPETKKRVFEAADRDALNRKSAAVLNRLAFAASRLSGLGDGQDKEIAKDFG